MEPQALTITTRFAHGHIFRLYVHYYRQHRPRSLCFQLQPQRRGHLGTRSGTFPVCIYTPLFLDLSLQASTAMIVANLAVLVIWFMHLIGHREESQISPNRTAGGEGTDQTPPKDLSTLRFNHDTGPIILHPLDRKGRNLSTLDSFASRISEEGSLATMTFATNTDRDIASKVDRSPYLEVNQQR